MNFSHQNYFELFGLPQCFGIALEQLDSQYRRLQSEIHPDRFAGGADNEKRQSLQKATQVNDAYQTLKNPLARARYLLQLKGIETLEESNTAMPVDFLMQQMEWREALEENRVAADVNALDALLAELRAAARALYGTLAQALDVEVNDVLAAETVRKLKFIDKVQSEVELAIESLE